MGPERLVLFERWMDTTQWLMQRTHRFPRPIRHSLTDRIENAALAILEDLTTAAYRKQPERTLRSADERLSRLRVLLRLAHALGHLSGAHYEEAARRMAEAGRMVGGWRKQAAGGVDG